MKKLRLLLMAATALGFLAVPQTASATPMAEQEVNDPLEGINRTIFNFNTMVDYILLEPLGQIYHYAMPTPIQTGIQNFLRNLRSPIILANNLLQVDGDAAWDTTRRFAINTTVGVGGVMDIASDIGVGEPQSSGPWAWRTARADKAQNIPFRDADFGQTLGVWGWGGGPYLVLPLIGPINTRDAVGLAADTYADPVRIYLTGTNRQDLVYGRVAVDAVDSRSRLIVAINDLRSNSLDYYATVRSIYAQQRAEDINKAQYAPVPTIPDYDDDTAE